MNDVQDRPGVLAGVGDTPLVALQRIVPRSGCRLLVKMESANPTGSMKDRMAVEVITAAAADGRLPEDGTVVEYTAGTTGISLAFVCAALGYGLHVVFSDAFSTEKRRTLLALGATVTDEPSQDGQITADLIKRMIARSERISRNPSHWWSDQLTNRDAVRGYAPLGEEIWVQSEGQINAFIHTVGTAHSIQGVGEVLRRHHPTIRLVGVEPAESAVLGGGPTGAHRIEGIGIGFVPPLWEPTAVDDLDEVTSAEAQEMARRLAVEEGLFAGTSTGANVVAALREAERYDATGTVVTLAVDSGLRYLSTAPYA
ncbi:MAG: cysteine synthase family protein [Nocardioides sp.]